MKNFRPKTDDEIKIMAEGGAKLKYVKEVLRKQVGAGVSAFDVEKLANELIEKEGGKASFKMVPGYSWATCISVNEELVHGIPKKEKVFKKGDLVSVDVGIYFKGFHTDTSFSVGLELDEEAKKFLEVGKMAFQKALSEVRVGNHIYDISQAIQDTVEGAGYSAIRSLVGHGVGRDLHEEPQIPCFVPGPIDESPEIVPGMVLAVEVMYALGSPDTAILDDDWTIVMRDDKISALFEDTIAVSTRGVEILTA